MVSPWLDRPVYGLSPCAHCRAGDRIAIISHGRIEQRGDASDIYHRPRTTFAADFIGQANLFSVAVVGRNGTTARVRLGDSLELTVASADLPPGALDALVSIRPEKIHISKCRLNAENVFAARIEEEIFQGTTDQLLLVTDHGTRLHALVADESAMNEAFHEGDRVYCGLHLDDLVIVQSE